MATLTFEDGIIKLGSKTVDCILSSLSISASLRYDEETKDSGSSSIKRPIGFEDAEVTVSVQLITDDSKTCYDRLTSLNNLFKATDSGSSKIYNISNRQTLARGIRRVLFGSLSSSESNEDDIITAELKFIEYDQPQLKKEQALRVIEPTKTEFTEKEEINSKLPAEQKKLYELVTPDQFKRYLP